MKRVKKRIFHLKINKNKSFGNFLIAIIRSEKASANAAHSRLVEGPPLSSTTRSQCEGSRRACQAPQLTQMNGMHYKHTLTDNISLVLCRQSSIQLMCTKE